jgi:hypothetical protein
LLKLAFLIGDNTMNSLADYLRDEGRKEGRLEGKIEGKMEEKHNRHCLY